jgi:NAD(P)H-nitrite reductase large subunit
LTPAIDGAISPLEINMPKKQDLLDKGAIVQRDGETYAVTPRIPCGLITDFDLLRRMADVAERFGATAMKITSSQRIAIIGIKDEDIDAVWSELGMTPGFALGLCIRSIKACPGTTHCRLGQQDSLGLGLRIEDRFVNQPAPNKLKISVSGCPMDCAEAHVRDIGLIGSRKGYALELGGAVGASPRLGQGVAEDLTPEEAERLVGRVIEVYRELGIKKRLGKVLDQVGLDVFRHKL